MKEATGELNMTVVTVVAIAAVMAFFYAFVWPSIKNNIERNTLCSSSYGCNEDRSECTVINKDGEKQSGYDCSGYDIGTKNQ